MRYVRRSVSQVTIGGDLQPHKTNVLKTGLLGRVLNRILVIGRPLCYEYVKPSN